MVLAIFMSRPRLAGIDHSPISSVRWPDLMGGVIHINLGVEVCRVRRLAPCVLSTHVGVISRKAATGRLLPVATS